MACGCPRSSFSFHLSTSFSQPHPSKLKLHFGIPSLTPKILSYSRFSINSNPRKYTVNSIDVSKEDTPISEPPDSASPTPASQEAKNFDKRRLEEKFVVLNTGIYECRSCEYKDDEAVGDPSYPIPPGFQFEKLPDDWRCPTCGAAKSFFKSESVEIAGFAQNQRFGFGGNSLTSGQKALLIYGSLFLFFAIYILRNFMFFD